MSVSTVRQFEQGNVIYTLFEEVYQMQNGFPSRIASLAGLLKSRALPHQESDFTFFRKHILCGSVLRFQPAHHYTDFPSLKTQEAPMAYRQLTELYRALRLYVNCFQPSMKLQC